VCGALCLRDQTRAKTRSPCNAPFPPMDQTMTCQPTSMRSVTNLRDKLKSLSRAGLTRRMVSEPRHLRKMIRLATDFGVFAHRHQEPPGKGNGGHPWTTWLMLGGRGAGKTRLGAEWVRALVNGASPYGGQPCLNIALVGETEHDAREGMIE